MRRLSVFGVTLIFAVATTAFTGPAPNLASRRAGTSTKLALSLKPPPLDDRTPQGVFETENSGKEDEPFSPVIFEDNELNLPTVKTQTNESGEDNSEIGIWAARGLLLFVAMLWGTNFAAVKYIENLCFHPPCSHPPSEAAFARFGVAALVSTPLLIGQRLDVILGGMECGLWITFGYITQAMALETIGAGKCAFICSLTVVVVPLLSALLFGKEIKPINFVTAAIALSGVGVLEGVIDVTTLLGIQPAVADTVTAITPHATASVASESSGWLASAASSLGVGKGDLLALGQPLCFGFSFMRIEHYVEKFKDVENRVITIAAAECVVVGLLSLAWVLYDYHGTLPNFEYMLEPHRLATIAWTGIMTTVVAIFLQGVALQRANATEAALTFSSEPVWASIFSAWLLKEKLNANSYVGGAVILAACVIGALADIPPAEPAETEGSE